MVSVSIASITMSSQVDTIKERVNIVDVVSQYVKLTKAGKNFKGLSPFKKEKTPSFYVSPDKNMYYDFSSGQGGDVFSFVQAMEGVDFKGALTMLAERAGVELVPESREAKGERERGYAALEEATQFFETKLAENEEAKQYLRKRGLEAATERQFRIGFAQDEWTALHAHLTKKGYTERELEKVGLVKKGEKGSYYDRFRSRIVFPIADSSGRIIAFSGRIFGKAAEDKENAKYLNSPETPFFDKSRILYGYDKARQAVRKNDFAILVEGQMDIVLAHQAGYHNTVAVSGTGLTEHHVALVGRLTKRIVIAFDADDAGRASAGKAALLALKAGMDAKIVRMPQGVDPADMIARNVDEWRDAVKHALHAVEFFLAHVRTTEEDERKRQLRARDLVLPFVKSIPSAVDQAHFVKVFAETLALPEDAVWQELRALAGPTSSRDSFARRQTLVPSPREQKSREEQIERALAGFLFWQHEAENPVITDDLLNERTTHYGLALEGILARYEDERGVLAFEAELLANENTSSARELLDDLLRALVRTRLMTERAKLQREIQVAERSGRSEELTILVARFQELSNELERLE